MISLGRTCRPAHQIRMSKRRRHAAGFGFFPGGSYYFDWLLSPLASVVACIETDFATAFRAADMHLDEEQRAVDGIGIVYFHNFTGENGRTTMETIRAEYETQRQKMSYLATKTLGALRSCRRVLYVTVEPDLEAISSLVRVIRARHSQHEFMVLSVAKCDRPRGLVHQDEWCALHEIADIPSKPPHDDWRGNDRDWAWILDRARLKPVAAPAGLQRGGIATRL